MKEIYQKIKKFACKHDLLVLALSTVIFEIMVYLSSSWVDYLKYIIFVIYGLMIIALLYDKKNKKRNIFYLIYFVGVIIRTIYIINTDIYTRQHDVGTLDNCGHLSYIYTIFSTYRLPQTNLWQFYHPPFWHLLGSIWLIINNIMGANIDTSMEGLQILSLLLSSFSILVVNILCDKLKLNDKYKFISLAFMAFHPTMIILSGSINNDMLMIFLEMVIIILLIEWYKNASIKNTIILAIVTGLCVMTKMNGAVMAVPILYVFIKKYLETYGKKIKGQWQKIKEYVKKILLFGIISLPIGLWFPIRNMIKFKGYDIVLDSGDFLYVGDISLFKRLFTINFHELFNFVDLYHDYNLPAYLIKSSLFGEYVFENIGPLRVILIALVIFITIISLYFMIRYLIKDRKNIILNILIIVFISTMISMYVFNYLYPNVCTMDFRYIVITLVPTIIFITYSLAKMKNKIIKIGIEIGLYAFILGSLIYELMI